MRIYKNKDALLRAIEKKEEIINRLNIDSVTKFKNLGWGYANRGYKRLMNNSYSIQRKHEDDLENLKKQLSNFKENPTTVIKSSFLVEQQLVLF